MLEQFVDTVRSILKAVIITFIIVAVLMLLIVDDPKPYILGLVLGTLIGVLNFVQLAKTLDRAVTMSPGKAQTYATKHYFIRYALTGLVIYISIIASYIHVIGTIVGLVLIKLVIYITNLFNDKNYYKNIFRRKEDE